mmetsp:Transcript_310/g.2476  ORF Transcript_310/g.2476 Transcript_310/m.2476 type:complete len:80 (-) Transcript_310:261-500(-)
MLREQRITFAPFAANPSAIIRPMPRPPPVTTTCLPRTSNSDETSILGIFYLENFRTEALEHSIGFQFVFWTFGVVLARL